MTEHFAGVASGPAEDGNPTGTGVYDPSRPHQVQAFVPERGQHFRLPDGITKAQAVATTCHALRILGASERIIAVWRHIADTTERQAWHADDRAPVNWRRQSDLAREMGIGERQFRRIEAELARLGVIARATADNGYRGRRSGQPAGEPISCGLSIEPALANHAAFAAIVAEAEIAEESRQEAVLNARTAHRRVGLLIASLQDVEMRHWAKGRLDEMDATVRPASPRVAASEELSPLARGAARARGRGPRGPGPPSRPARAVCLRAGCGPFPNARRRRSRPQRGFRAGGRNGDSTGNVRRTGHS